MVKVREIRETDAAPFLELRRKLDGETRFMMLEPGERETSMDEQIGEIREHLSSDNRILLVAEVGGEIVGYIEALGGGFRRNRHCVQVVTGVLQAYSGRGIGTELFTELERWAGRNSVHRIELTVMAHNERALKLYRKMGYEVEGRRKNSLLVDGTYVDEYYMAKLLT